MTANGDVGGKSADALPIPAFLCDVTRQRLAGDDVHWQDHHATRADGTRTRRGPSVSDDAARGCDDEPEQVTKYDTTLTFLGKLARAWPGLTEGVRSKIMELAGLREDVKDDPRGRRRRE